MDSIVIEIYYYDKIFLIEIFCQVLGYCLLFLKNKCDLMDKINFEFVIKILKYL